MVRVGRNDVGYRLGNRYQASVSTARVFSSGVSLSTGLRGELWENITGADPLLNPADEPTKDPKLQGGRRLATSGAYAVVRHPQYVGFILVMLGFLLQWPTLVTLLMFPILIVMYVRLARREEGEVRAQFGAAWDAYAADVPSFVPRLGRRLAKAGTAPRPGGHVSGEHERPE